MSSIHYNRALALVAKAEGRDALLTDFLQQSKPLDQYLAGLKSEIVQHAMDMNKNNVTTAASKLKIKRTTLQMYLQRLRRNS